MKKPLISIIIPVKNGIKTIKNCLNSIFSQNLSSGFEVILIDSGSTDGTLELIKQFPVRLYQIPTEDFNHGATRNFGVSLAQGDLVYLTVQDALAFDSALLERMCGYFSDPAVMAVAGRQIVPHNMDKNPHQWFRPVNQPKVERFSYNSTEEFDGLPDAEKRWACGLDDVNAMYRKEALVKIPFRSLQFAEDMVWAADAYKSGFKIVIDPSSCVYHYHHQSFSYAYKVSLFCAHAEWKYLGILPKPKLGIWDLLLVVYRNFKYKAHPKWIINQFEYKLGEYRGLKTIKKLIATGEIVNFDQSKLALSVPQGRIK